MLDHKGFSYSDSKSCLTVTDVNTPIMTDQLDTHNLYYTISILSTYTMTAATSLTSTNLTIWHCRFAYLNTMYLKRLPDITSGMKIFARAKNLSSCTVCIQAKITRQSHRDPYISSEIPGFCIYLDVGRSVNIYTTWKDYWYFVLLIDDTTCVT